MLSWSEVIRYVKRQCGFPHHFIEYTDTDIKNDLTDICLRKFSTYFPDKWSMTLDCSNNRNRVPNRQDMYFVEDPDGNEILSIDEFIPKMGTHFMVGHPWMGAFQYNQIPEQMALDTFRANNLRQFSIFNYTIKFISPNKLRIVPKYNDSCALEYSRVHSNDLSTIPGDMIHYFRDFCLASFQMQIGRLRKNYTEITTPFGNVPLNADDMYSQGETLYNSLIDRFEAASSTYIIMDVG